MHILVTGREGQLAQALLSAATTTVGVTAVGRPDLDIVDPSSIERAIKVHKPDIVVNTAAYTAVDQAESESAVAFAVNGDGARHVAVAAASAGLPIIQISTDYVFSGDKPTPYEEVDLTGPLGVYGRSKLAGERAVAEANPRHAILRTSWIYSSFGKNFLKTMLNIAGSRDIVRVVADQYGTPTYAADIAAGILAVAGKIIDNPGIAQYCGIFHMVSAGDTNWAGFAEEIFRQSARCGGPTARVAPISSAEYPTQAKRPANSRLCTSKFERVFSTSLPPWQDGVQRCVGELYNG